MLHYIDADSMDYDITLAESGDKRAEGQVRQTLNAALALIDPIWGGVYQYSDKVDWSSPHFEKIMSFQAQYLREYSQAYARWHERRYLGAANLAAAMGQGYPVAGGLLKNRSASTAWCAEKQTGRSPVLGKGPRLMTLAKAVRSPET